MDLQPFKAQMKAFIINYSPFSQRLKDTLLTLSNITDIKSTEAVNCWDREDLNNDLLEEDRKIIWEKQIRFIRHILCHNALPGMFKTSQELMQAHKSSALTNYQWLKARDLSPGELSVCMKHYYAIASIAQGKKPYGLIVEDDIRHHEHSNENFSRLTEKLSLEHMDYVDLAGGCGLTFLDDEVKNRESITQKLKVPRTRTAAAYILSKALAKQVACNFFPLAMPIDWHLQYIFILKNQFHYHWCTNEILVHGSEHNLVSSWRNEA